MWKDYLPLVSFFAAIAWMIYRGFSTKKKEDLRQNLAPLEKDEFNRNLVARK